MNHDLQLAVQWEDGSDIPAVDNRQIKRWVSAALATDAQLTVRFVDTKEGQTLNRDFRGKDYATNVLTFSYQTENPCMADIVICTPVVAREAKEQEKAFKDHLGHMLVHATLHAQGYDHETDEDAAMMEALEIEILKRFRIDNPYA